MNEILYVARCRTFRHTEEVGFLIASPYPLKRSTSLMGWESETIEEKYVGDFYLPDKWFPNLTYEDEPITVSLNFIALSGDGKHKE